MTQAIEYEARWQIETLEDGGKIQQATVLFNPETGETKAMRSKEEANDYRYFPDPDLLPLEVTEADKARVKAEMPELPEAMKNRFESEYALSSYDASSLTSSRDLTNFYVNTVIHLLRQGVGTLISQETPSAMAYAAQIAALAINETDAPKTKLAANWVMGSVSAKLNAEDKTIAYSPISPEQLSKLLKRIADNTISNNAAKQVFEAMWNGEGEVDAIIEAKGLKQESDSGAIEAIIDEVLAANAAMVEEFKAGKEKAFNALVGQAMKASKGKANPAQVNEILKKKLGN